jgi:PKD domain
MVTSRALLALVAVVLVATSLAPSERPASPAPSFPASVVTAVLGGWSWSGSGEPCEPGSNLTFLAHFFGNASGGSPPYSFVWSFGDGSNSSRGQNVTHVFLTGQYQWNVTLNVSDQFGSFGSDTIQVNPPSFSCPAEEVEPSLAQGSLLPVALGAAAALGVGVFLWVRRREKP